jgi:membrane-bound lytic murein transglycosylase D
MTIRPFFFALATAMMTSPLISVAQTAAAPTETNVAPTPVAPVAPTAPATPTAAPAPAASTEAPVAPGERPSTYTVAQGDSLWTIAHKYGTTVVALRKLNKLKKGALLHPGQVLQLPPAKADAAAK